MRLFEYQWLRALGGRYKDFMSIIDDAHTFAAGQLDGEPVREKRLRLRDAFSRIKAWPDAESALIALKSKRLRLGFLSNMTVDMLDMGLANSGLEGLLDYVLSTHAAKTFKPDPAAYQLGVDTFRLPREKIAFASFAGWDAAGAAWFGYPTFWINRLGAKTESLMRKTYPLHMALATLSALLTSSDRQTKISHPFYERAQLPRVSLRADWQRAPRRASQVTLSSTAFVELHKLSDFSSHGQPHCATQSTCRALDSAISTPC
jgi:2-haloalkanoic acid dehalogenase type II